MSLLSRLRGLLQINRLERDLDEELRSHVEMRTADNVAAGMGVREARYDAQRRFGNTGVVKEDTRAMDIVGWIEATGQNLRYAGRMLRRTPGFTLVAILTLALGIGANVAIFTVVHGVLLQPLAFPHPEQLVRVYDDLRGSNGRGVGMSPPELWDLRDKSGVFEDISALWSADSNLTGGDHPERIEMFGTSANYFTMLGVTPELGRTYTMADAQPSFSDVVVISDAFWHRNFGADPNVIGKKVRLDSDLYTIVGVMPPNFHHPGRTLAGDVDVWLTAGLAADPFPMPVSRAARLVPGAMGRLKAGLTLEQAQARLDNFVAQLSREYPDEYSPAAGWSIRLVPTEQDLTGNVRTELFVLFAAVGFVLLIACVNLANLLLARSASRQREIAIRAAVGASRGRLIAQLLTESILLAAISGAAGLLAVVWLKSSLLRLAPADLPRLHEVSFSPGVMLFAFLISILTGVFFGLAPALRAGRASQVVELRERGSGAGSSKHQSKLSGLLVASEIALSLVLLIGAGLLLRSFGRLLEVSPGFEPHHLITAKVSLPNPNDPRDDKYLDLKKRAAFYQEVLRRVSALPGVEQAALGTASSLPMDFSRAQSPFMIESRPLEIERTPVAEITRISPSYFSVLKTPLLSGRVFSDSDDVKGQRVALVNDALARRYWPNSDADAIGQRIRLGTPHNRNTAAQSDWLTVVGVVANIKSDGFDAASEPHIYRPVFQDPDYDGVVYLRTMAEPGMLGDAVRAEVWNVDSTIPVFGVRTMDFIVSASLAERRFALELLGIFAAVALLLAAIGIYGVMSYTFTRRTNEIGIRIAMGAQRSDILRLAVGEGTRAVVIGVAAGLAGSAILTRFLQSMLFDVKPTDLFTYATIAGLLTVVALLACLVPAHRATRVDPLIALRHE
jgi:predicted permease